MDIDQQMLRELRNRSPQDRPLTIGDFARSFGANPQLVVTAARRLVDDHLAEPFMVDVHGVPTLHGLKPAVSRQPE
jgi:hypothetical protein